MCFSHSQKTMFCITRLKGESGAAFSPPTTTSFKGVFQSVSGLNIKQKTLPLSNALSKQYLQPVYEGF